jgi:hypothetical protein
MLRAMGRQRLAGAHRAVHHVIPLARIVEGAEHHAADQLQPVLVKRLGEDRRVFGHEADGPQLDAGVAGLRALGEHRAPGRIARVVCKFHTPGTGRIADFDGHSLSLQSGSMVCQVFVCDEARAAATIWLTASPSRKVGQTDTPVSNGQKEIPGLDDDLVLVAGAMAGPLAERQVVGMRRSGQDLAEPARGLRSLGHFDRAKARSGLPGQSGSRPWCRVIS